MTTPAPMAMIATSPMPSSGSAPPTDVRVLLPLRRPSRPMISGSRFMLVVCTRLTPSFRSAAASLPLAEAPATAAAAPSASLVTMRKPTFALGVACAGAAARAAKGTNNASPSPPVSWRRPPAATVAPALIVSMPTLAADNPATSATAATKAAFSNGPMPDTPVPTSCTSSTATLEPASETVCADDTDAHGNVPAGHPAGPPSSPL
mmetsp:Transcript_73749/g.204304  ORF Transcript_73749/g.204304 Transcript_73749/m.204304 type:complete len:206 (-) Transcript_73749:229-846(-)